MPANSNKKRVVVTGIGLITSLGNDVHSLWESLSTLKNTFSKTAINTQPLPTQLGAEVTCPSLPKKDAIFERANKFCQLAVIAAEQAIDNANISSIAKNNHKVAVIGSTAFGSPVLQNLADYLDAIKAQYSYLHSPSGLICIRNKIKGPSLTICNGEASGSMAISWGTNFIQSGRCNFAIVGASEVISRNNYLHYAALGSLSPNNNGQEQCIPYDAKRNGFVLAEGATYLVLEEFQHAIDREATIYGEIIGHSSINERNFPMSTSGIEKDSFTESIKMALNDSDIQPADVDLIYGAANGDNDLDHCEGNSIGNIFGNQVTISSIKSLTGEGMSMGGVLNVIAGLLSIKHQKVVPIVNFTEADPSLRSLQLITNNVLCQDVNTVICNAHTYGGVTSSTVIRKVDN